MKAIILAAGRGTRFGNLTKLKPKPLIEVNGKSLIMHVIDRLPKSVTEIGIVVSYKGQDVINFFKDKNIKYPISFFWQGNKNGTGGALLSIKSWINSKNDFLVIGCDDIFGQGELEKLTYKTPSYGLVYKQPNKLGLHHTIVNKDGYVSGFKKMNNDYHPRNFSVGAYIINGDIFNIPFQKSKNGEYSVPHTIIKWNKCVRAVFIHQWFPVNSIYELEIAENNL